MPNYPNLDQLVQLVIRNSKDMLYDFLKRTIDIAGSLVALIILSPLMVMVIIGIKGMSEGPIFYTPERVGTRGRAFIKL